MSKSASLILFAPVVISAAPVLLLVGILGGILVLPVAIGGSLIESASAVAVEGVALVTGRPTQVVPVAIATEVIEAPIELASVVALEGVSLVTGRPTQVVPVAIAREVIETPIALTSAVSGSFVTRRPMQVAAAS
jgi:hypothetical protein